MGTPIQVFRTTVAGRTPNTTVSTNSTYIGAGGLALNMPDQILYTSDGTNLIRVGANQVSLNVSTNISVGANVDINPGNISIAETTTTISLNSSTIFIGNSTVNATINSTMYTGSIQGSISNALTANNATYFGGQLPAFYAPIDSPNFTTDLNIGANILINNTTLIIGNSTVNSQMNSSLLLLPGVNATTLFIGNSTVNQSMNSTVSTFGVMNVQGNTFFYGNVALNSPTTSFTTGTTPTYTIQNSTQIFVGNSTTASQLYANQLFIGGTNCIINSTAITYQANTFTLGTSSKGANGYTYLPNGIKLCWGWCAANATTGTATFASAFTTLYNVQATSNGVGTFVAGVIASNTTTASIRTSNGTLSNVYYHAIGV